jgi:alpha-pyrone synthase
MSRRVPTLIGTQLRPWLTGWLEQQRLRLDEVGSWAIHPGGPKVLDAVEDCLGLSAEMMRPSREVLAEYGNMSSPTVLFIIDRLCARGADRPCVALAFGPGLTAEAALLR